VTAIDLRRPQSAGVVDRLNAALRAHRVLWFPGQQLTHDQLVAVASAFGAPRARPAAPPGEHTYVLEIRREADETAVPFGAGWHSDGSFRDVPEVATLLHAKVVPAAGGDTLFADCVAAFEALPDARRAELVGLRALHSAQAYFGRDGFFARESGRTGMRVQTSAAFERTVSHPMVRTDPADGVRSLFISPGFTVGVEEMESEASGALLAELFAHMTSERFVYRHRWAPDMLVVWDNRRTLHSATAGYDGQLRLMHRVVAGAETPV
jgi:taurine dioxygenase